MNPEKIGSFIKEIRKKNGLTQKDLADKYGVTYQAVSKWENGKNLPDISLMQQMSKDFNISLDEILDGEVLRKNKLKVLIPLIVLIVLLVILVIYFMNNYDTYNIKTIKTTCDDFNISGSIVYDKSKYFIHIPKISYCGTDDDTIYQKIECNLYERNGDSNTIISNCNKDLSNVTLDDYLQDLEIAINNTSNTCKYYTDDSLYLEINATDKKGKITTYKIPLKLEDNC